MNYWTELGWLVIPMVAVELGFTLLMCLGSHYLGKNK